MKRSKPPTLTTLVGRILRDECDVRPEESILVAVSGGGDSTALLHALWLLSLDKLALRVVAAGVDHGLRAEAATELDCAERLCRELGVEFERIALRVPRGANLQARAREARYRALREVQTRRGLRFLATAHHQDDRAETVLIRLLRGAPPAGLAVLPARSDDLLRPMIRASRDDVRAHLERHRLRYAEDPSNEDTRFLRVRLRRELIPLLRELSPSIAEHLCTLADELGTPTLPPLFDAGGSEILLGQAQRRELHQALRDRSRRARVLLKGGRILRLIDGGTRPEVDDLGRAAQLKTAYKPANPPKKR